MAARVDEKRDPELFECFAEAPFEIRDFVYSRHSPIPEGFSRLIRFRKLSDFALIKLLRLVTQTQRHFIKARGKYMAGLDVYDVLYNPADHDSFKLLIEMAHPNYDQEESRFTSQFPHLGNLLPMGCEMSFKDDDVIGGSMLLLAVSAAIGQPCSFWDVAWMHTKRTMPNTGDALDLSLVGETVLCWGMMHVNGIPNWRRMYSRLDKLPPITDLLDVSYFRIHLENLRLSTQESTDDDDDNENDEDDRVLKRLKKE